MNSCPKLADTATSDIPTPNMEENIKIETPLAESPQQKPSSSNLASTANDTHPRAALTLDEAIEYELKHGRRLDPNMDQRKLRRTVSNRLSAQRSRIKKVKYIDQMEKTVIELEKLVLFLTPQVETEIENKKELMEENESLQKLAAIRLNESKLAELEVEKKQAEIARLKELEKTAKRNIRNERLKQITTAHPCAKLGYNYEIGTEYEFNNHFYCTETAPTLLIRSNNNEQVGKSDDEQQQLAARFTTCKMPFQALTGQGDDDNDDKDEETDQYINFEALNNVEPTAACLN
ncbi:hypothetical protein ABFX02_04G085500 [Erythranthe guttata]